MVIMTRRIIKQVLYLTFIVLIAFVCWEMRSRVTRLNSPDGRWDALMIQSWSFQRGLVDQHLSVFIVDKGKKLERHSPPYQRHPMVFDADDVVGPTLLWRKPDRLEIHYSYANVWQVTNPWFLSDIVSESSNFNDSPHVY